MNNRPDLNKLDQHVRDVAKNVQLTTPRPRPGIIISYEPTKNTATVLMTDPTSDQMGELYKNVPCPVYHGLQLVAPEPGRPCFVNFKGENDTRPYITNYFNHEYTQNDYPRQTYARAKIPRYWLEI